MSSLAIIVGAVSLVVIVYILRVIRAFINKDRQEFSRATSLTVTFVPIMIGLGYLLIKLES